MQAEDNKNGSSIHLPSGPPEAPKGFRSFVTDMKKDFPTIDEFIKEKEVSKVKA